jgi:hypothetical protein
LSTGLCVALAAAIVTTSVPALAAPLPLLRLAPDEAPASVLGLDGEGKEGNKDANSLTNALRKAFANRGLSGGEEISLEEMRLTMGCSNDEVGCLAEGGKTLGVRRLVFGYLKPGGGGSYQLDIQILDVESGQIEAKATVAIAKGDLASGDIDAKANAIVNELMPAENADSDLPPRTDPLQPKTDPQVEEPVDEPPPPKEGGIYFGLERPTPRWKWAGFGTMLGLTVLTGGAFIGTAVWLKVEDRGFRRELLDAAEASLTDDNPLNDVEPTLPQGLNLCEYAGARPTDEDGNPLGQPGQVRNTEVTVVCRKGDAVKNVNLAAGIGMGVFGAATLVFTGLLVIHKRKPAADAMLRHGVHLGVGPTGEGGLTVAGGLRF